jgi:DnaK suppressor protein
MRKREKDKFRNLLLQLRKEITREIQQGVQENREGEAGDGRDTYDIASDERDREISLLLSDRERRKLQQIDDALHRIDTEEYGVCEECDGEIATGRLEAMPFSRLCVTCQSEFEQAQRTVQAEGTAAPAARYPSSESEEEGS